MPRTILGHLPITIHAFWATAERESGLEILKDDATLNAVWFSSGTGEWEGPWIDEELLGKVSHRNFFYPDLPSSLSDKMLIIFVGLRPEPNNAVIELLETYQNVSLLVLSDQKMRHKTKFYGRAVRILRPHYSPFAAWNFKTYAVPLGYHHSFGRATGIIGDGSRKKKYPWSFFGHIKNEDREQMLEAFLALPDRLGKGQLHRTTSFNGPDAILGDVVAETFDQTFFVPCPLGFMSPDSFRVMEALERRAIPVVVEFHGIDYFNFTFGDHPFIVAKNWEDAANMCRNLLENPKNLSAKLEQVEAWYQSYLMALQLDVAELLLNDSAKVSDLSQQFRRQVSAKLNPLVLAIFWRHFRWPSLRGKIFRCIDRVRRIVGPS